MDEFTGMVFHSAEREVERLERQLDEARQEAYDLRRQVAHANNWRDSSILDANEARQEAADLRRQLEHANRWRDTAILEANEARAEAADLRRQLAAMTKMRDAAARGVEIREEILTRKTAEFKARLQAEINLRTLSTQDGEVDEFNAGYEACKAGQPIEAEPSDLPFDVWRQGWMVADYERMSAELSTLRRQLADAQAELLHYKTNGVSSIAQGRQIAFTATE